MNILRNISFSFCLLLAGCGGGGGGADAPSPVASNNTSGTGSPTAPGTSAVASGPAADPTPATSNFSAYLTIAPAEGAAIAGSTLLEIRGSGIANAELLPPAGYAPRLGIMNVSPDRTSATLDFDTMQLPNGRVNARISAFDAPAGTASSEIVAMPARRWEIRNDPAPVGVPIPPASVMPEARIPLNNLPYVDPQPLVDMTQLDAASFERMIAEDWPRVEAVLRQYVPANVVFYPPTPLGFHAAWSGCIGSRIPVACRESMNYLIAVMRRAPR